MFPNFRPKSPVNYDTAKRLARENALAQVPAFNPETEDIFRGVDAYIIGYMVYNTLRMDYDAYYEWIGKETAAMSQEVVISLSSAAKSGHRIDLEGLLVELIEYSPLGDFWYVRKAE